MFSLSPRLFTLLERILGSLGFCFNKTFFIYGCKYSKTHREQCTLANFAVGQAKLAIWKTCRMATEGRDMSVPKMFTALVESRIRLEQKYYQITKNLLEFESKWCVNGASLSLCEDETIVFNW